MKITWVNGAFVEGAIAIDPADRGLNLGDGLFETVAVLLGRAVWLDEHIARMKAGAMELGLLCDDEKIRKGVAAVLRRCNEDHAVLRITLTRGVVMPRALSGHGEQPTLLLTLNKFDPNVPASITLATSTIRRNETSPASRLKTLSYVDAIMAAREVTGQADDALMLNTAGHVASTTIGNLFLVHGDRLITPQSDQGILCGIARAKLLTLAQEMVVELADLYTADAVFRTNSLRLVTPVTMLNGKWLGMASVDHFKQKLQEGMGS